MRATDHRYTGERAKFELAMRMIALEARTGTIRHYTGFSEDRVRKIYGSYFRDASGVRRRRGKSPSQIAPFVNSTTRQSEATALACLYLLAGAAELRDNGRLAAPRGLLPVELGGRVCDAYETYRPLRQPPLISFEWARNLFEALVSTRELYLPACELCGGRYVQDTYALDYRRCPLCELKDGHRDG